MTREVGRPTKYKAEMVKVCLDYVDKCRADGELPVKEELAYMLDIDGDTIVEWRKIHPRFSAALKKLELAQATMLQKGVFGDSKKNVVGGIFLLKVNHGFKDRVEVDVTSGGGKLATPIMMIDPHVRTNHSDEKDSEPKTTG